jgi:hypothetical protein
VAALVAGTSVAAAAIDVQPRRPVHAAQVVQGTFCLPGGSVADLNRLFDAEPAGLVGADYQRALPLPDGRVLWTFQDAAVRAGPEEINVIHNAAMVQDGRCFEVLYGGTRIDPRAFMFAGETDPFRRWFWPLDAEIGADGLVYVFAAEMVEHGDEYLTHVEPTGTRVAVFDPTTSAIVTDARPGDDSADLYGWSITSDRDWTYLYAQCHRQFGYDLHIFTFAFAFAFDRSCSTVITVARLPRGELLATPEYWDGLRWQPDPDLAAPIIQTGGRLINANQIEWSGGSFFSVNHEGDWWGDTIHFARAEAATGPFVVFDTMTAPVPCEECNSFFATWIPRAAASRPPSTLAVAVSHNRWDGIISAFYRPSFHVIASPPALGPGATFEVEIPDGNNLDAAVLNITAVNPNAPGYITAHRCDQPPPTASNLNYSPGDITANLVIAHPDPTGHICLTTLATTDLVIDLTGTLPTTSTYQPLDNPTRITDTRNGTGMPGRT